MAAICTSLLLLGLCAGIIIGRDSTKETKELMTQFWPTRENWKMQLKAYALIAVAIPPTLAFLFIMLATHVPHS